MNLAVSIHPPWRVVDLKKLPEPKPLIFLGPEYMPGDMLNGTFLASYCEWVRQQLPLVEAARTYALVAMPVHSFQTTPITDAELSRVLGPCYPQQVLAVYFMQGPCTRSDYWLRLYGAVRQGLRTKWVVEALAADPKQDEGEYRDTVCKGAFGCYLGMRERLQPGVAFPIIKVPNAGVSLKLTVGFHYLLSSGIMVIPSTLWVREAVLWTRLLKWKN